ncbi:MAG: hypothetical protein ACK5OB_09215 [Pirellula sp.]
MAIPKKRSSTGTRLVFTLSILGICFLGLITYMSYASVQGMEFSPNTFSHRHFNYYRLPFTKARLTATTLQTTNSTASADVLKHLQTLPNTPVWHVAWATQYREEFFPAKVMYDSLTERNADGKDYWGAWSNANPQRAAVLWPLIQQAAYHELYFAIPDMLECAEDAPNADQMERDLFQHLADALALQSNPQPASNQPAEAPDIAWFLELQPKSASSAIQAEILAIQQSAASEIDLKHP